MTKSGEERFVWCLCLPFVFLLCLNRWLCLVVSRFMINAALMLQNYKKYFCCANLCKRRLPAFCVYLCLNVAISCLNG